MPAEPAVDPITLAVVSGALTSAVAEMSVVIERTARSTVVALSHDYSNAIYTVVNGEPEMVVQGQDQPCHLGGMIASVKSAARIFAGDLAPGDVIVGNDPVLNGTHLLDIDVAQPIFVGDQIVGWACSRAHEVDIGGPVPGGYNPGATDIHAEGLRIPPTKVVVGGTVDEGLWNLICANVRTPELFGGDLGAQLSAVRTATRHVQQLAGRYGADPVQRAMGELLDRAERWMRAEIAAIPDGSYTGDQWLQDDGRGSGDRLIAARITVAGDQLTVALDPLPAVASYRNSYPGLTVGAVYYAILSAVTPGVAINEGAYRPLAVQLGEPGTMLNARHPQACAMSTGDIWTVIFDATCAALAQAVPERACAGWTRVAIFEASGVDPRSGESYGSLLNIALMGGAGAVHGQDGGGLWGVIPTGGAATTGDVELLELRLPLRLHRHELATDSACPGRWRGAAGATVALEIVDHDALLAHVGDGTTFPPPSRGGGGGERDRATRVHRKRLAHAAGGESPIALHTLTRARAGDVVLADIPGGGAVGRAFERDPELVRADVLAELVSVPAAREEYGVVLHGPAAAVDVPATAALRSTASSHRPSTTEPETS
jgi:N-methylhydantoinase B